MKDNDIVKTALEEFKVDKDHWSEIYEKAREDLLFLSDEPNAQWDERLLKDRKNRPIYQVDQLSQFIHQVSNDIRMNTPSIEIIPDDEESDTEDAEFLQGWARGVEYKSSADAAYDTAVDFAIKSSIGFIRVDHDYASDEGFEQELQIKRVINPGSCIIDSNSIQPDGSDSMRGFVLEDIPIKDWDVLHPDKNPVSFGEEPAKKDTKKDKVTIVEYFKIIDDAKEYGQTETGEVEEVAEGKTYKTKRKINKRIVKRYKLSGEDVLEETTFPGKYVPIVPVYGEEAWVEGKRHLNSLIRKAKSSQQMFNLGISLDVEMLMKQPQASFMAAAGAVSGFEHEYADPTKANVLHFNQKDVNGDPVSAPQRVAPPQSASGFMNMSREAVDNIKSTLGMYNASLGQKSNEISGRAINARKEEGDVGNYHFGDNLVRSITQVGKILICARGEIYDTPRAVKMVDKEDNAKMMGINGHRVKGQDRDFDMKKGNYGVRVTTGPAYVTQRQDAADNYTQIIQAMPELMPVIGDLVFKYQDAPGSQAISARLKKTIDPKLLSDEEKEKDQPDPQVLALTQQLQQITQEAGQKIQELEAELKSKQGDLLIKQEEVNVKKQEVGIKAGELKLKYLEAAKEPPAASTNTPTQTAEVPDPDDSIEVLQAKIMQKINDDNITQQKAAADEAQRQLEEQTEAQRSQEENQIRIFDIEQRGQQANALLNVLGSISGQIGVLTQQVSKPITIERDENGAIIGAQ